MFHTASDVDKFVKLKRSDIQGFEFISVHAPIYKGGKMDEYMRAMDAICKFHSEVNFNSVVLHPDAFDNFKFLKQFDLPFAIENMDNRKKSCKDVTDLHQVFNKFDVPMVLDMNHCFSNDSSMKLADDLVEAFCSKIEEIHLSGFDTFHDPLFKTKQEIIMDAMPDISLPIIIESGLDSVEEINVELEYIKRHLANSRD